MKNIFLLLTLSLSLIACDKLKKAEEGLKDVKAMGAKMDTMNDSMNQMAYDQRLALPLKELMNQEYYDLVDPIPFDLAAWADGLAKYITVQDLVKFADLQFLSIDDATFRKKMNEDGKEIPFTLQDKVKMNNRKSVVVSYLSIIASVLPAKTVDGLIEEARSGAYSDAAIKLLMLRYSFIKDFQFDSAKMGKSFTNMAMAQAAFDELEKADQIARLDRKGELHFETKGLVKLTENSDDPNYNIRIDHDELKSQWRRLLRKLENDQPVGRLGLGLTPAELDNHKTGAAQKLETLKTKVQSKLDFWNQPTP